MDFSHLYTAALVGKPNAGKSSLFNALLSKSYAIVHEEAGVTRDTLRATLPLMRHSEQGHAMTKNSQNHTSPNQTSKTSQVLNSEEKSPEPPLSPSMPPNTSHHEEDIWIFLLDTAGINEPLAKIRDHAPMTPSTAPHSPSRSAPNHLSAKEPAAEEIDFEAELSSQITDQILATVQSVDIVVVLFDLHDISGQDHEILALLRTLNKPILTVFNKADLEQDALFLQSEAHALGVSEPIFVSAKTAFNLDLLKNKLLGLVQTRKKQNLPPLSDYRWQRSDYTVSIIGRPNAGKSSLLNALHKKNTALVHHKAGTTRDLIEAFINTDSIIKPLQNIQDTPHNKNNANIVLRVLDTAGLRRRTRKKAILEVFSVQKVIHAINQSDIAIMLIDATETITEQDKKIAAVTAHAHKPLLIGVNKWDLYRQIYRQTHRTSTLSDRALWVEYLSRMKFLFPLIEHFPVMKLSAQTGMGVIPLVKALTTLLHQYNQSIGTHQINTLLKKATSKYLPPTHSVHSKGRALKIYYGLQINTAPPVIKIFINHASLFNDGYKQYLINFIKREVFAKGIPLILLTEEKATSHSSKSTLKSQKSSSRKSSHKPTSRLAKSSQKSASRTSKSSSSKSSHKPTSRLAKSSQKSTSRTLKSSSSKSSQKLPSKSQKPLQKSTSRTSKSSSSKSSYKSTSKLSKSSRKTAKPSRKTPRISRHRS